MFKNYITIAWRNLFRNKIYSLINISGLALGLTVCMLILLYIGHEYSYDSFHENSDRKYLVETDIKFGDNQITMPYMGYGDAILAKESLPSIKDLTCYKSETESVIIQNPKSPLLKFSEEKFIFADSNFFDFFSFKLSQGDKSQVLNSPFSIVISEVVAEKYFGNQDPIGEILKYNNDSNFIVTGVIENVPSNSSIKFDFVASVSSLISIESEKESFENNDPIFSTYILLNNSVSSLSVESDLLKMKANSEEKEHLGTGYKVKSLNKLRLTEGASNIKYIKIFPFIAILILILALINYASLSTARSTIRAKEIGVRKVLGANRKTIASQFFVESALYTCIAFFLGFILFSMVQPYFFNFLQIRIDDSFFYNSKIITYLLLLFCFTVLLSGIYPSVILSAYKPINALNGRFFKNGKGISVRKFFTVFQFSISIVLIICSFVIDRQMYFMRYAETGVQKENVIMIPFEKTVGNHLVSFKEEITSLPVIKESSVALNPMYGGYNLYIVKNKTSDEDIFLPTFHVDQNFVSLLGLEWKTKPDETFFNFNQNTTAILNEAALEKLTFDKNVIEETINGEYEVKGVLKDFNFSSLQNKIDALCLLVTSDNNPNALWKEQGGYLFAKVKSNVNMPSVIQQLKRIYEKYDNEKPFEYRFLNDAYEAQFQAEDRLAQIFSGFTIFAILIASMGLFGLAIFMTVQRRKETGIRKVLGASTISVIRLLSKDFFILILLAVLLASPIAYWLMEKWLQNFAYGITVTWWMFLFATIGVLCIAMVTIGFHTIKAARANPVKSLRTE